MLKNIFSLICLVCCIGASHAESIVPSCTGSVATYDEPSSSVCLPSIEVRENNKLSYYRAQLQLIADGNPGFNILIAEPITTNTASVASFDVNTGTLVIPSVELRRTFGVERYRANLNWRPDLRFGLTAIAAIISPNYAPGKTWKPYVGLLPNEKQAVNHLAASQPYATLANAVYDFGNSLVGGWTLLESVSRDTGMQAAVYSNRLSGELVLAYRGTDELCFLPISCSFKQIEESGNDSLADTLLTQGRDSGQFHDAYVYAQTMISKYSGRQLTVTGHSLGGALAQAVGASFKLKTFAFNSAPVANNFFDAHGVQMKDDNYQNFIHIITDIHDPVSVSTGNVLSKVYDDATHLAPLLQFDFDKKEILPTYKTTLDSLRLSKHSMETLLNNITLLRSIYADGW